ncbi:EAL domain, c-di-GMP-specific phosphodiesterase class I (or its enzymatically inactive variant) [Acetitomaculum ruminis DSM 5522]|uniref:EAL domain, c-di-GMP-specific phosphodiesterase class I (Or its enzymatically inactive variant) n=1 Tax=Acetitomaculum ruminis DSM 5522 TaxID=1120918 RepID=A0A1I0X7R0_9FIRM|nr:EAL domain-containing protein [Acetitomaculum ruminis]SFA97045.1 EAL domain, c-di-GMP-specific phosphodiesterase class I (or its enzymatically inactive variant) [Acetitomaculum ruminis DSM 5522]
MEENEYAKSDLNKELITKVISFMPGGFFIYRADDKEEFLYANKMLLNILECDTTQEFYELTGGTFKGMVLQADLEFVEENINNQVKNNADRRNNAVYRVKTKNGLIKSVADFGIYVEDPKEGPLYYVFITDAKIGYDVLTGLPNRDTFFGNVMEDLEEIQKSEDIPVMVAFDLRGLRGFNIKYGISEGDKLLNIFANILRKHFGKDKCSRFEKDQFYAHTLKNIYEEKIKSVFDDMKIANEGKTLYVKAGVCDYEKDLLVNVYCDRARMACDIQKATYESGYGIFDETLSKNYENREYILSHFDEALEKGWIKVYFQPVIRTLTNMVCSVEALIRWIDPVRGFISPGDFVPLLEENGLSYKLDTYMINKVAQVQEQAMIKGRIVIPVSVNISRSDFEHCDIVDVVVRALDEHNLRRKLICVEITESAFITDEGILDEAIRRFHEAGIEVWMDDFGSGYSSLNVLKDFKFDEIKIDMLFLRNFGERSKVIVTKVVEMAKSLGIHTLAEGVETEEQLKFLKSIGCEKIQGYYYSKAMPYDDQIRHLNNKGMTSETNELAALYEKTGLVNLVSYRALALIFYNGESFVTLYGNEKYNMTIKDAEVKIGRNRDDKENNNITPDIKFIKLAEKAIHSKSEEPMTFVNKDKYFYFSFKEIASSRNGSMLLATIDGSIYETREQNNRLDDIMRNIMSVYESIYLIDLNEDSRFIVVSNLPNEKVGDVAYNLRDFYYNYNARLIFHEDTDRWGEFIKIFNEKREDFHLQNGSISEAFRVKNPMGNYEWTEFTVIELKENRYNRYLICTKTSAFEENNMTKVDNSDINKELVEKNVYDAIKHGSPIKFFWKDTNRRFVGVSDEFLKYYGFSSYKEVVGKCDEEVGWHINDELLKSIEEEVLNKGKVFKNVLAQNIVDGAVHNIATTKFPIYNEGKIVGLMGYMIDLDEDINANIKLKSGSFIDELTGLMNINGQIVSITELGDNLRINGEDYSYTCLEVLSFTDIMNDYGKKIAERLILKVSRIIKETFGVKAVVSRVYAGSFGICLRGASFNYSEELAQKCIESINKIKEVGGMTCYVYAQAGVAMGSECDTIHELLMVAKNRMIAKSRFSDNVSKIYSVYNMYGNYNYMKPDPYIDIPACYFIGKVRLNEDLNGAEDFEFCYVNKAYCEYIGKQYDDLVGKGYMELFYENADPSWVYIGYSAAVLGERIRTRKKSSITGLWTDSLVVPAAKYGYFITLLMDITENYEKQKKLQDIKDRDEIILRIANLMMRENDINVAMSSVLSILNESIFADRLYIMIIKDGRFRMATELCALGAQENKKTTQNESIDIFEKSGKILGMTDYIHFNNVDIFKEKDSEIYEYYREKNVRSILLVPLYGEKELLGYIGTDNYEINNTEYVLDLLKRVSFFVSSRLMFYNILKAEGLTKDEYE